VHWIPSYSSHDGGHIVLTASNEDAIVWAGVFENECDTRYDTAACVTFDASKNANFLIIFSVL
jgi:hypothetical protein